MITGTFLALSLFLGYLAVVGLSIATTFGITTLWPDFVAAEFRIRRRFKFAQDTIWLISSAAGGYITAFVVGQNHPLLAAIGLVSILIAVLWTNVWEMRQRGLPHQIAISLLSLAGVVVGFALRLK